MGIERLGSALETAAHVAAVAGTALSENPDSNVLNTVDISDKRPRSPVEIVVNQAKIQAGADMYQDFEQDTDPDPTPGATQTPDSNRTETLWTTNSGIRITATADANFAPVPPEQAPRPNPEVIDLSGIEPALGSALGWGELDLSDVETWTAMLRIPAFFSRWGFVSDNVEVYSDPRFQSIVAIVPEGGVGSFQDLVNNEIEVNGVTVRYITVLNPILGFGGQVVDLEPVDVVIAMDGPDRTCQRPTVYVGNAAVAPGPGYFVGERGQSDTIDMINESVSMSVTQPRFVCMDLQPIVDGDQVWPTGRRVLFSSLIMVPNFR